MTGAANEAIRVSSLDWVLTVTIDRPEARNALRVVDKRRITEVVTEAASDDVGCIVLVGAGEYAFCAGSDLKEMSGMGSASFLGMQEVERAMYDAMMRCPVPIVAAVHGWALGTGWNLPGGQRPRPRRSDGPGLRPAGNPQWRPTPIHGALLPHIIGLGEPVVCPRPVALSTPSWPSGGDSVTR